MRGSWRPNRTATHWPPLLWPSAFLSRSPGLLNGGPGAQHSLGHIPQSSIFSPIGLIPNSQSGVPRPLLPGAGFLYRILSPTGLVSKLTDFLSSPSYVIVQRPFFLWASQLHSFNPSTVKVIILIFLDRMHLLFTQVHFLFWQPGRVVGQYTTDVLMLYYYYYYHYYQRVRYW